MKLSSILSCVSLGAALATACGGIATVGNPLGAGDAGRSPSPEQDSSAGSSSGGGAPGTPGVDAGMPAFNVSCQGTQSCPPSQICCATISFGTGAGGIDVACAPSCAPGAYQICASTAECTNSGDVCTPSPLGLGSYCAAGRGGGTRAQPDGGSVTDGGAHDASASLDAAVANDAASNDAATVDATSIDAMTMDAPGVDATTADAATADATAADAATVDATGDDATGDEATDDGSADDGSSDFDAGDP